MSNTNINIDQQLLLGNEGNNNNGDKILNDQPQGEQQSAKEFGFRNGKEVDYSQHVKGQCPVVTYTVRCYTQDIVSDGTLYPDMGEAVKQIPKDQSSNKATVDPQDGGTDSKSMLGLKDEIKAEVRLLLGKAVGEEIKRQMSEPKNINT